jgi:hypothetical protein
MSIRGGDAVKPRPRMTFKGRPCARPLPRIASLRRECLPMRRARQRASMTGVASM